MRTPTLNHYFEPKIMRIIIEIIQYVKHKSFGWLKFQISSLLVATLYYLSLRYASETWPKYFPLSLPCGSSNCHAMEIGYINYLEKLVRAYDVVFH